MNYYKLGCNWESNSPVFLNLLKEKNIVIGVEDTKYEKGDYVLVTDGFDAKAIAIIQENPIIATDSPHLYKNSFNKFDIPFTSRINVYENIIWIDVKKPFQYKLQAGIRKINQAETINKIKLTVRDFRASLELDKITDLLESKNQIILQGPPGTGKTRLAKEIAHQLIFNKQAASDKEQKVALSSSEQFKIVQFHASYSYEDFVRGISVENIDGKVIYETKNRILGEIAAKANKNYLQSNEDLEISNKTLFLDEAFDEFITEVAEKIEGADRYELTDNVSIVSLDEDAFRYKGKNGWIENGNRMKFSDIKQAFLDGNTVRQDVKKNKNLASQANWHSSYYVRVLNDFQKYWDENLVQKEKEVKQPNAEIKNYVLIIDEINRANLSSVLGELIYALEYRGEPVESIYDIKGKGREIVLPENLFIIGTMNTADRSVGHIDYAIRRRFAFESVLPKDLSGEMESGYAFAKAEFEKVKLLFVKDLTTWKRSEHLSEEFDAKDVCIGHSYFICESNVGDNEVNRYKDHLKQRMDYEIKPILEEYIKDGVLKESDALREKIKGLLKDA